jgi:hypothetical protein
MRPDAERLASVHPQAAFTTRLMPLMTSFSTLF